MAPAWFSHKGPDVCRMRVLRLLYRINVPGSNLKMGWEPCEKPVQVCSLQWVSALLSHARAENTGLILGHHCQHVVHKDLCSPSFPGARNKSRADHSRFRLLGQRRAFTLGNEEGESVWF